MIGIFIICFLVFPIAVLVNLHKSVFSDAFLNKQDSNVIKGIATSFVILAHLTSYLQITEGEYIRFLRVFTVMGGGITIFLSVWIWAI